VILPAPERPTTRHELTGLDRSVHPSRATQSPNLRPTRSRLTTGDRIAFMGGGGGGHASASALRVSRPK